MEATDLKINETYQYKCGEVSIKVVFLGKNTRHNNISAFKALEGKYNGVTNLLSTKSVENYITKLENE